MSTWKDFITTLANGIYPQSQGFTEKDKMDFLVRTFGNPLTAGNTYTFEQIGQILASISNNLDYLFFVNRPFVAKGSSGPITGGNKSANYIYANELFTKIHFTVTAITGAANFVIEVSDDGTIFQTASFFKSNNTTKVNTIPAVLNDIYILDIPYQYWRISNTGAGATSLTIDCYGFK